MYTPYIHTFSAWWKFNIWYKCYCVDALYIQVDKPYGDVEDKFVLAQTWYVILLYVVNVFLSVIRLNLVEVCLAFIAVFLVSVFVRELAYMHVYIISRLKWQLAFSYAIHYIKLLFWPHQFMHFTCYIVCLIFVQHCNGYFS